MPLKLGTVYPVLVTNLRSKLITCSRAPHVVRFDARDTYDNTHSCFYDAGGGQMQSIYIMPSDDMAGNAKRCVPIPLVRKTYEGLPTPEKPFPMAIFYKTVGKREF